MSKKLILGIFLVIVSCSERPDSSVETPEVKIIEDYFVSESSNSDVKELVILNYQETDLTTVIDSIEIYKNMCLSIGNEYGIVITENTNVDGTNDIDYVINNIEFQKDSIDLIIRNKIIERDKNSKLKNRDQYRKDYQSWVFEKRNSEIYKNRIKIGFKLDSLKLYKDKINRLGGLEGESIISKVSTVKLRYVKEISQKRLISYLMGNSNTGWTVNKLIENKLIDN